jgi:hypothetical protein
MALWCRFDVPFLSHTNLQSIHLHDMTSIIMQGVDEQMRPYLAMRVFHDGDQRIGFIIQRYPDRCDEWEYGVLEQLDVYTLTEEQYAYMIQNTIQSISMLSSIDSISMEESYQSIQHL